MDPTVEATPAPAPRTAEEALAQILRGDPLSRRPGHPSLDALPDAAPLAAWAELAHPGITPDVMAALELQWPGTAAVGLSRGWRLGDVEDMLVGLSDPSVSRRVLLWLSPMVDAIGPASGKRTWATLGDSPEDLLRYGEGWVLRGWLDGPEVPLGPVAQALTPVTYDRLIDRFEGRLILARAGARPSSGSSGVALQRFAEVMELALERAAAERDAEQEAHLKRCQDLARTLGLGGPEGPQPDPLPLLAAAARDQLIDYAGEDHALGAALLAHSLARWLDNRCPDCRGLDRSESSWAADRWSPELASSSRALRVVLLKLASDRLEVGMQHGRFGEGAAMLADALIGMRAGPLELSWLERSAPAPGAWLSLSRATGASDTTDQDQALRDLHALLAREARAAQSGLPPAWVKSLETIAKRSERRAAPP